MGFWESLAILGIIGLIAGCLMIAIFEAVKVIFKSLVLAGFASLLVFVALCVK